MRVVMASSDPIETYHNIVNDRYSIKTLEAVLEMLDVKEALSDDINKGGTDK